MGTGRYGSKHTSKLPSGVRDITDRVLDHKYGKSSFMRDIHSAHPEQRGLNATLNSNPGNYTGGDVKPEIMDFFKKDKDGRYIDFNAYKEALKRWEDLYQNNQDPYYQDLDAFQNNCQRCVIAWEANYRGYDVEARQYVDTDNFANSYHQDNYLSTFRNFDGTVVQPLYDKYYWNIQGSAGMTTGQIGTKFRSEISNIMLKEGNGARFVIDFSRRDSLSGHTFTAEVVGNKIVVYEPQYARTSALRHYINSGASRVRITRVDNAYLDHAKLDQAVTTHGKRRHINHGGKYTSRK
jgi:hypothetical protein